MSIEGDTAFHKGMSGDQNNIYEMLSTPMPHSICQHVQDYNMRKRVEHAWKSLLHEAGSDSVTNPRAYAHRFIAFLNEVFVVDELPAHVK